MRAYLLFPVLFMISCSGLKKTEAQTDHQLLKDVEVLSSDQYEGRKTGTKGAEMARAYLKERFKAIGLNAYSSSYEQPFSFNDDKQQVIEGKNIVGYVPGRNDGVIVVSAHYDHLGIVGKEIYNGADDNASGVAGLLQLAAYFVKNKPEHTLIFAAFDAEEMGLRGAEAFVAHAPVALEKIRLNVNMDMISHNDKGELYVCGTFKYPELKKFIVVGDPDIKVLTGHDDPALGHDDWTDQSDQGAFNRKNIPFLYFGVEDHKDYHKASDEYRNINKAFFIKAVNAIQSIVGHIDKDRDTQKIFRERLRMDKQ